MKILEALNFGKGYDHTYILNKKRRKRTVALRPLRITQNRHRNGMLHDTAGRTIIHRRLDDGQTLSARTDNAIRHVPPSCLETRRSPDSPNKPEYPSTVLRPGETSQSKTIYKFTVE